MLFFYFLIEIAPRRRGAAKWIYVEIIYNLFVKFLIGYSGIPSAATYVSDLILAVILFYFVSNYRKKLAFIPRNLKILVFLFFSMTVCSYFLNFYSPLLYLWGIRNNLRFLIFAVMCVIYLEPEDVVTILDILYAYFLLNIIAVTYEYFFLGLTGTTRGDFISGLYSTGVERGGNEALNCLLCIVSAYGIVMYLLKKNRLIKLGISIMGSIYIASLSELKIYFIELVIIAIIATFISKKSFKSVLFLLLGIGSLSVGIRMLYFYFPQFDGFFTRDTLISYVSNTNGYLRNDGLNRLTAFTYIFENFLKTKIEILFGIGLGNADYSSFSILTSPFYIRNGWTCYQWFYGPFLLIETGIIGLTIFVSYILTSIRQSYKLLQKNMDISLQTISFILGFICLIVLFYNQSLKMESAGYMMHFVLMIPFILSKQTEFNNDYQSLIKKRFRIGNWRI